MRLPSALTELAALALPTSCAVCGETDEPVCRPCCQRAAAALRPGGPTWVAPDPRPPGLPAVVAAGRYEGALARLVTAYKDDGRRDLCPLLAGLLAVSVDAALARHPVLSGVLSRGNGPVLVVPAPPSAASRRRRGDAPLLSLARAACAGFAEHEVVCADALRMRRRVADQAGLSASQRRLNLEHASEVRSRWRPLVRGAHCLLVDDVLTTGATLVEARRALLREGAAEVVSATICATARRRPTTAAPGSTARRMGT